MLDPHAHKEAQTNRITIFEMGPRDGLQNEARMIPTADKIRLVDMLSDCGFEKIETSSFVSPKWVPQMADAADVFAGIHRRPGTRYTTISLNMKGYERAMQSDVDEVAVGATPSEGFSRSNTNCSAEEGLERMFPILERAKADGMPIRGYVSCVVACPFDGAIAPAETARVATALMEGGCYEISLGDTIGAGTPDTIGAMLDAAIAEIGPESLAGHYHDTNGRALENIRTSIEMGLRTFDSSIGGLGGCPYAPGAQGNVATEGVAALADDMGFETGLDRTRLKDVADFARTLRSDQGTAA